MATRGAVDRGVRRSGAIRHEGFLRHEDFRWAKIAAVAAVVALLIYALDDPATGPSGGTAYGYILGTVGVALILWLTALGFRKRTMTKRRWSLKAWTSAHVYLGLSLLVIGTLHTAFHFGWNVHTLAYALMVLVIASGFVGIILYAAIPRALSDNRGEMTQAQMIDGLAALDRQLHEAAQPLAQREADLVRAALAEDAFAVSALRRLSGRTVDGPTGHALDSFRAAGRPRPGDPAERVESLLERRRSMLARMRRHMRLKALLEIWLYVHVPCTVALIAALVAHVVAVFFYW